MTDKMQTRERMLLDEMASREPSPAPVDSVGDYWECACNNPPRDGDEILRSDGAIACPNCLRPLSGDPIHQAPAPAPVDSVERAPRDNAAVALSDLRRKVLKMPGSNLGGALGRWQRETLSGIDRVLAALTDTGEEPSEVELRNALIEELQDATDEMKFDLDGNDFAYVINRLLARQKAMRAAR